VVFEKTLRMLEAEPEIELASLAAVGAPTLVLQGDRDEVTLEAIRASWLTPIHHCGWRVSQGCC
jgi:hypothetical protein